METTELHPLPWRKLEKRCGTTNIPDPLILDARGGHVCGAMSSFEVADDIIRAVNCHEELLAACQAVVAGWDASQKTFASVDDPPTIRAARAAIARAAIARATGQEQAAP